MKTNLFAPHTFSSSKRFYLVQAVPLEKDTMIKDKDVEQVISTLFQQIFGKLFLGKLNLEVNDIGTNNFIISVPKENSVPLRSALTIPITSGKIQNFEILSESSFMQPLMHDSRLFYQPLE